MTERIYVDRTTTWHAIGKSVQECKDMEQVLAASGLDYTVEKRPVFSHTGAIDGQIAQFAIPNRFVTVRTSDDHPYDVVSDKFEIIQNRDAFDFVNYMGDELSFEKAGETANGMVYIIGKLPEVDILGDAFTPHVIFRNGFRLVTFSIIIMIVVLFFRKGIMGDKELPDVIDAWKAKRKQKAAAAAVPAEQQDETPKGGA